MMDKNKIWDGFLKSIENSIPAVSFKTWFSPLYIKNINEEAGVIYIASTEDYVIKQLQRNYMPIIEKAFDSFTDKHYRIVIKTEEEYDLPQKVDFKKDFKNEKLIDPRYTFENFVVGNSNKVAHAVSLAVAESPGETYNPLYIYGDSGLGKTHLMHAIGLNIIRNNPKTKVLYVTTEIFTNDFIQALQTHKMQSFQDKYRKLDVLLIDDIQFLQDKLSTQEEFFNTFNALYQNSKQIVITSDNPPNQLKGIEERLVTRFNWNMIVEIEHPDFETRVAILNNLAKKNNLKMDNDLRESINLIAEQVENNVRSLESAFTRVVGISKLLHEPITPYYVRKTLKEIIVDNEKSVAPERIRVAVANYYKVKLTDIDSSKRNKELTEPRQVAMYLCRELTNTPLTKIGKLFGDRNHSTVVHSIDKIKELIQDNDPIINDIQNIKNSISTHK